MALELVTVPCLKDNYAFLIHDPDTGQTAGVDAPEPGPIQAALAARGWTLSDIWITHHHWDHIDGVEPLRAATSAMVLGAAADAHRLPRLDLELSEQTTFTIGSHTVQVIDVPGHTVGHIAFHIPSAGLVFTADSLMAMGCGRLFEGTPAQMWQSLSKLADLPPETIVCSGHEYTAANLRFAMTLEPDNPDLILRGRQITAARDAGQATVPSTLKDELNTNPFLRAGVASLKTAVGLPDAPDALVFAEIRARKDRF
jgi:hydroxyacylglutathione hydrolase